MSYIEHINLIDGINVQPIPLSAGNEITTTKWLMAIQDKVNNIIDIRNNMLQDANNFTNEQIEKITNNLNIIIEDIKNGNIFEGAVINPSSLGEGFKNMINKQVNMEINKMSKGIFFTLKNGRFIINVPETWDELKFDTDLEGHLILRVD